MKAIDVHERARQLHEARGDQAVVEAAQKAVELERLGKDDEAELWRRIEKALILIRGPHAS
jgi:hypothetical protein